MYTTRQLLDALLLVSGNDAANMLADMLGGYRVAVAKMNARPPGRRAQHPRVVAVGTRRPRVGMRTTAHDLALIFRAALAYPMFAHIIRQPSALFPGHATRRSSTRTSCSALSRHSGRQDRLHDIARQTYVGAAQRSNRRLVVVQMYGTGDLYGQAIGLFDWGFSLDR